MMSKNDYYQNHLSINGTNSNSINDVSAQRSNQIQSAHLERIKSEHRPVYENAGVSSPIPANYASSTATIADESTTTAAASQQQKRASFNMSEPAQSSLSNSPQLEKSQQQQSSGDNSIYTATYSGVHVFEMLVNGVAVMRRRHDSSLNATQILKVAGVEKSKRTKVLEKEILTGVHEKVQGGYGKYQGTWIPFQRAVDLCKQYSVYDMLEPLLQFDANNVGMENTPTKEQAMAAKRKRSANLQQHHQQMRNNYHPRQYPSNISFSQPLQVTGTGGNLSTPLSVSASAALSSLGNNIYENDERGAKKIRYGSAAASTTNTSTSSNGNNTGSNTATNIGNTNNGHMVKPSPKLSNPISDILDDEGIPETVIPLIPVPNSIHNFDQSRELVTQIFMDNGHENLNDILAGTDLSEINFDVPIDEYGHTALHWAAALARIPLIKELVKYGANPRRGNYQGESPLIKAVSVTNNSDYSRFTELLDILYPAIPLVDKQSRTVLHHMAVTAGIKGRSDSSRYYLESLLEWIVKRGSKSKTGRFGIGRFMSEIVNAQDQNGDTALNIAARIGNKSIAQLLLDVGADATLPNRAGLRPVDFGIKVIDNEDRKNNAISPNDDDAPSTSSVLATANKANLPHPTSQSNTERRKKIVSTMVQSLESLENEFDQELKLKEELINSMRKELRESKISLTGRKERLDRLKSLINQLAQWQRSSVSLERAVEDEDRKFKEEMKKEGISSITIDENHNFDADQPFRVWLNSDEIVNARIPPALLKARITAYQKNQTDLEKLASDLRGRSTELEQKFRKVVAKCTGVEEDQVDSLLPGLVQAVESDPPEVDMSRVAGFLRKVDETMTV